MIHSLRMEERKKLKREATKKNTDKTYEKEGEFE